MATNGAAHKHRALALLLAIAIAAVAVALTSVTAAPPPPAAKTTCPPATGFTVKADVFVDTHKALKCDNVTGVKTAAAKCVADPACHGFTANITAGSKTIRVCYLPGVATDVMLTKGTPVCLYSKKPKK